jgi:hypothetical protein
MYDSPDDKGWIERQAKQIAQKTGWPLPIAKSEAMAEFVRIQQKPRASVVAISQGRLFARKSLP